MDLTINPQDRYDLEDHFILRLPQMEANFIREVIATKSRRLRKHFKLTLDPETGRGSVVINSKYLEGRLRRLPTIVESLKTTNRTIFTKTADIGYIFDCVNPNGSADLNHGVTPPMKNVKVKRFRKCLINKDEDSINIQKELFYLLQTDLEATSTRFELVYFDDNGNKSNVEPSTYKKSEIEIFGNILTDSEESDSNTEDLG